MGAGEIQFVQDLLEPEFVDLMDDDEQGFIMLWRGRKSAVAWLPC